MRELPLGTSDFALLRQNACFYADKTKLLYDLVKPARTCFLTRPRRFGKTLVLSALEHILHGHRELFKGLWIDGSDYDWTPSPVVKLSLASLNASSYLDMEARLWKYLCEIGEKEDVDLSRSIEPRRAFSSLISCLYAKYGRKVAVLVDDYDAPITQNLREPELAEAVRQYLFDFFFRVLVSDMPRRDSSS
jgi:hypothetical protein